MNKINAVKDAVMEKTHMGGGSHQTGVGVSSPKSLPLLAVGRGWLSAQQHEP